MNLGQLEEENEKFVNSYKKLGYTTRTQLANEAISLLRLEKAKIKRENWLADAFTEMVSTAPDLPFSELDGEDFVNKSR